MTEFRGKVASIVKTNALLIICSLAYFLNATPTESKEEILGWMQSRYPTVIEKVKQLKIIPKRNPSSVSYDKRFADDVWE
jgi:hypothetical protein